MKTFTLLALAGSAAAFAPAAQQVSLGLYNCLIFALLKKIKFLIYLETL
jgi:hypothetical protein